MKSINLLIYVLSISVESTMIML